MNNSLHFSSESNEHGTPQEFFDRLNQEFEFTLDVCASHANAKADMYFTLDGLFQKVSSGSQKGRIHQVAAGVDGLSGDWIGTCWMNPPYSEPEQPCSIEIKPVPLFRGKPPVSLIDRGVDQLRVVNAKYELVGFADPCKKKRCGKRGYHVSEYIAGQIDFVRKAYESARDNGATVVALIPARTDTAIWHNYIFKYASEIRFVEGRLNFENEKNEGNPAPFPSAVVVFRPKVRWTTRPVISTMKNV